MKRPMIIAAALSFISSAACTQAYGWQDYQLQRILNNVHQLKSFEGTLVEQGVLDGNEVSSEIAFSAPNRFSAKIVAPAAWAGTSASYDGKVLLYQYPALKWAIRIKGLALPVGKDADRLIEYRYGHDLRTFDYQVSGTSKVAGLSAITLNHTPKGKHSIERGGWNKVYDKFSFPLAGALRFGKAEYGYHWAAITFNQAAEDRRFGMEVPAGTFVSEWDLTADPVTLEDLARESKAPVTLPEDNSLGLKRVKIVRAVGPVPAFCAQYARGPHFLLVMTAPSGGISVPAYGLSLPISGGARLILGPTSASLSFVKGGTYYTLMSNLPPEELLKVGQKLGED